MKNKIISIVIEHAIDDSPDTSFLGEYTSKRDEWNINRRTGTFVHVEMVRDRIIEALQERIDLIPDKDTDIVMQAYLMRMEKRLEKIEGIVLHQEYIASREYPYFAPYACGEKPGSPEYKKYAMQAFERMERLSRGSWCFIGIIAKAQIGIPDGQGNYTLQTIVSGGLWGIESDSGKDFIEETEKEELSDLSENLTSLGFGKRAIAYAMKNVERKEA
jgi:hypothetical protein